LAKHSFVSAVPPEPVDGVCDAKTGDKVNAVWSAENAQQRQVDLELTYLAQARLANALNDTGFAPNSRRDINRVR
jgi:hypothetical protein